MDMGYELPFRGAMLAIFVASAATAAYRRINAAKSGEKISRSAEGRVVFWTLRIAGIATFVTTLVYLVWPTALSWARIAIPTGVRWIGLPLGLGASALVSWTLSWLGANLTDTVVTREHHTLVTGGPYAWVRHPYYSATRLLILAAFLLSANGLLAATGFIVLFVLAIRTPNEERQLLARFGDAYRAYADRTPRYFPRLTRSV